MSNELPSGLTAPERETVFQMDDASEILIICTAQARIARKLFRTGATLVRESRSGNRVTSQTFSVPVQDFKWSVRPKRIMSDEERQKRAASLRARAKLEVPNVD